MNQCEREALQAAEQKLQKLITLCWILAGEVRASQHTIDCLKDLNEDTTSAEPHGILDLRTVAFRLHEMLRDPKENHNMNQCEREALHAALDQAIDCRLQGTDGATGYYATNLNTMPLILAFSLGNRFVETAITSFPSGGGNSEYRAGLHILADIARRGNRNEKPA
jgi:hypothetical protein